MGQRWESQLRRKGSSGGLCSCCRTIHFFRLAFHEQLQFCRHMGSERIPVNSQHSMWLGPMVCFDGSKYRLDKRWRLKGFQSFIGFHGFQDYRDKWSGMVPRFPFSRTVEKLRPSCWSVKFVETDWPSSLALKSTHEEAWLMYWKGVPDWMSQDSMGLETFRTLLSASGLQKCSLGSLFLFGYVAWFGEFTPAPSCFFGWVFSLAFCCTSHIVSQGPLGLFSFCDCSCFEVEEWGWIFGRLRF